MKLKIEFGCGHVRQVFEIRFDGRAALKTFDVPDETSLEAVLVEIAASESILGLQKLGLSVTCVDQDPERNIVDLEEALLEAQNERDELRERLDKYVSPYRPKKFS